MEKAKIIYTIGRQFGSGGRKVGRTLAEKLGIPFYDKELLTLAAKDSGLSEALFHNADEKPTSSLLYSLVMGNYPMSSGALGFNEMPLNDQLFLIQSKTIKKIADQGSCVIIGRCADYVLRDNPNVISVFIHAPLEARVHRAVNVYEVPKDKAEDICLKNDKSSASEDASIRSSRSPRWPVRTRAKTSDDLRHPIPAGDVCAGGSGNGPCHHGHGPFSSI